MATRYGPSIRPEGRPYFSRYGRYLAVKSPLRQNLLDPNDLNGYGYKDGDPVNNPRSATGGPRTPANGDPNTTKRFPGGKPGTGTDRTYGPDGRAVKDIDYGHDHGAGDPHAHDWDWTKNPPRQPGRPLTPDETEQIENTAKKISVWTTVGIITYWILDEGSRILFPPRNLVPIP